MKAKRRNPQDDTRRNQIARKKEIAELTKRVLILERVVVVLCENHVNVVEELKKVDG